MMDPEKRAEVVAEALTWLRTPYHHQGRIKGAGVDCAMIMTAVYHAVGLIPDIDPRPYPNDWHMHRDAERYLGWVEQYCVPTETPLPGDIATFQYGRCVSHGAIVIEWPIVLHAYMSQGMVVLSDVSVSEELTDRLRGIYTHKD
jgi:cell wall-associated NlpC family hydrolase